MARRLDARGIRYEQWLTLQHTQALLQTLPTLGLRKPDRVIANGNNGEPLRTSMDVVHWLIGVGKWLWRNTRSLRREMPSHTVIVVHGDTMTSVVGAQIARRLGVDCAHIEAGLRSGDWRHPFPEELDRRIVGKLATVHYAPSREATENLKSRKNVVFTHGNTVLDAVLDHVEDSTDDDEKFGVVLLHRFEFISNVQLVRKSIETLASCTSFPLRLLVDAYSARALKEAVAQYGQGKIRVQPKLQHHEFIGLLKRAQFIVTDSGGIQEETALIGVPTLIHRKATERAEGLGENIVLSGWSTEVLADFIMNFQWYRRPLGRPKFSPSDIIVDDLVARGYATTSSPAS